MIIGSGNGNGSFSETGGLSVMHFGLKLGGIQNKMNSSSTVERRSVLNDLSVRRRRMRRNTSSSQSPRIQTGLTPGKNPPVPHEGGPIPLPEQNSEDRPELNRAVPALVEDK